jgi:hypothetical protein
MPSPARSCTSTAGRTCHEDLRPATPWSMLPIQTCRASEASPTVRLAAFDLDAIRTKTFYASVCAVPADIIKARRRRMDEAPACIGNRGHDPMIQIPQRRPYVSRTASFASGADSPVQVLEECLAEIDRWEAAVGAFTVIDAAMARDFEPAGRTYQAPTPGPMISRATVPMSLVPRGAWSQLSAAGIPWVSPRAARHLL